MPIPPLAHLGHWYVSLPIFMGPVLLIAIALKIQTWRERRNGPDTTGKRSTVITTTDNQTATLVLGGPLDYPVLVELEAALSTLPPSTTAIMLDLLQLTSADKEAAWSLCDAIGRSCDATKVIVLIADAAPHTKALSDTLQGEGIVISHRPLQTG
jgi:hypothetical protein